MKKKVAFIKMTWPWKKLFKEFILGEQKNVSLLLVRNKN